MGDAPGQIERLFEAALHKDPSARAEFLEGISGVDPELRRALDAMFAALDEETLQPETTMRGMDSTRHEKGVEGISIHLSSAQSKTPDRIGRYRLLRKVGEGGMGVVHEGEQKNPVRRRVAVKLIKWGMDTKAVIARFESERQALALMNHPNIASVYDAGATKEGRPYFVMEYVQGIPITRFCDSHRLTVKERLELFSLVCTGVQHAHQKGVIHRDIKPSNVLVAFQDDKPVPKIIDFGVAKATSQRLTEHTVATELGQLIGTPGYMSPEQAEMTNLDIDTRTDVYSLGVLLYVLLAGALPFDSDKAGAAGSMETRRALREEEPPRPSTRVGTRGELSTETAGRRSTDPVSLSRQLKGDLDWIILKALEKDRARRYDAPAELEADIRRYLADEPVAARPPGTAYRLRKFVRRHRAAVIAAGLVLVALVLGLIGTAVGLVRARRAEAEALREARTSGEVANFLVGLFEVADPSENRGESLTAREILDSGAERVRTSLSTEPEIRAQLIETIAGVYKQLGMYGAAIELLEESLARQEEALGETAPSTIRTLKDLGDLYRVTSRYEAARKTLESALDRADSAGDATPEVRVGIVGNLALTLSSLDETQEAERLYLESLEVVQALYGKRSIETSRTLHNLALLYRDIQRFERAEEVARDALAIKYEQLDGDHPLTANTLAVLGAILMLQARFGEAEEPLRESLDMRRRLFGDDHPAVSSSWNELAFVLHDKGDWQEAEQAYRASLELDRRHLGERSLGWTVSTNNLATLLEDLGRFADAEAWYRRSLEVREELFDSPHRRVATIQGNLARLLRRSGGDLDEAEHLARAAHDALVELRGERHSRVARSRVALANILFDQGHRSEAIDRARSALELTRETNSPGHPDVAKALASLARMVEEQRELDKATALWSERLEIRRGAHPADHPYVAQAMLDLGRCHLKAGRVESARPLLRSSVELFERRFADDNVFVIEARRWLERLR